MGSLTVDVGLAASEEPGMRSEGAGSGGRCAVFVPGKSVVGCDDAGDGLRRSAHPAVNRHKASGKPRNTLANPDAMTRTVGLSLGEQIAIHKGADDTDFPRK